MARTAPAIRFLIAFSAVAVGLGAARAATTSYVPVLLDEIGSAPGLIGVAMLTNAAAGFIVPLLIGAYADRNPGRAPLIAGGVAITAGGLTAVALGSASTYVLLTLAAGVVYVGLNVVQTIHRTLVPERFEDGDRARVTSAQELAQLVGALAGTVVGGVLVLAAPELLFIAVAAGLGLLLVPTIGLAIVRERRAPVARASTERGGLRAALRRPGARELLVAQALWVLAYIGLTPFFALYAKDVLGLGTGVAGAMLAGFGLLTGVGMLIAARVEAERVRTVLAAGALALGGGLTAAAAGSTLVVVALPFAVAAVGAGLVTSLGFVYYSRFVPDGQTGAYSGAYFSVRAAAAAVALPLAGLIVEVGGSYRALLAMGVFGLAAVVPIRRAEARPATRPVRPLESITAVIPVYRSERFAEVARATAAHVDRVVLVDDGAPYPISSLVGEFAEAEGIELIRMDENRGKGTALAAGIAAALAGPSRPDAIMFVDSDGQHPPELIPSFVAAAEAGADAVVGRRDARAAMPLRRRLANRTSSLGLSIATRRWLPDTQNGMRLIRTDALDEVALPDGRYEAETRHLKELAAAKRDIAWVEVPAIYNGEPSDFHPVADSLRVARAILAAPRPAAAGPGPAALLAYARTWVPRMAGIVLLALLAGQGLAALQPLDEQLFLAVNGLGDGPDWLYHALDPHSRNYVLLALAAVVASIALRRAPKHVAGAVVAVAFAAFFSDLVLEVLQLSIDRERPEEALGAASAQSHGRTWGALPSFPSGHMMVTAAIVATIATAVRGLRYPLLVYLGAIALTRITFGAHFPLDVLVGTAVGWEIGLFAAGLAAAGGLLPGDCRRVPEPSAVPGGRLEPAADGMVRS